MLARVLKHRGVRTVIGVSFLGVSLVSFFGAAALHQARSPTCDEVERVDLTLEEMGKIKRKVDMHRLGSPLAISAEEASFILNDHLRVPVHLQTKHNELLAHLAVPDNGRCWNVVFQGTIDVHEGVAEIKPRILQVGGFDLSAFAHGRTLQLDHRDLGEHPARKLLASTQRLTHKDGTLVMEIHNIAELR